MSDDLDYRALFLQQQQQITALMGMLSTQQQPKPVAPEIVFENLSPTETLREMIDREIEDIEFAEIERYINDEDYGVTIMKKWLTKKPLNDRPLRFDGKDYRVFVERKSGVREWALCDDTDVGERVFLRLADMCCVTIHKRKDSRYFSVASKLNSEFENDGDTASVVMMMMLNQLYKKDESKLANKRKKLVRRLNAYIGKN